VRWLIDHGADLNALSNGRTALMIAASQGRPEIAKLLIDAKADLDLKSDSESLAAVDYARLAGRDDIVAMLRAAGAKEGVVTVEPAK
jgi:ankyrin repeat protein